MSRILCLLTAVICLLISPLPSIQKPKPPEKTKPGSHEHPLDPLSEIEIRASSRLLDLKHGKPRNLVYCSLDLDEPTKDELKTFESGKAIPRRAFAVMFDLNRLETYEAVVDLKNFKVIDWQSIGDIKAFATSTEIDEAEQIVRQDAGWQKAMKARGFKRLGDLFVAVWSGGASVTKKNDGQRLFRALTYYQGTQTNSYATPVEGVIALVDVAKGKVIKLTDTGKVSLPPGNHDFFSAKARGVDRPALKPLTIQQPKGVSFIIRGHEIRWEKWRFRWGMHSREGLVLHRIGYEEKDKEKVNVRSILHRASLSEMVVPYGDTDPTWSWRAPFDQGDYGMGWAVNELEKGVDVPENAVLFDAVFPTEQGGTEVKQGAVAIYERDGGILWKHQEDSPFTRIGRRARELVVTWIATLGNYDYGFHWIFRQDGSIQVEVDMTGIVLAKAVTSEKCELCQQVDKVSTELKKTTTFIPKGDQRHGTLVSKRVIGVNHQHIFNFRLDFDVDGTSNCFTEMNVRPHTAKDNVRGNAFIQEETLFALEKDARRSVSVEQSRSWKVFSSDQRNSQEHQTAYVLIPRENGVPLLGKNSLVRKRAAFMDHNVWVTRHRRNEMHAAGDYPRQNPIQDGLPLWSGNDSIVNQDLVLWYTLTATHVPRPEEWPVMPTAKVGFRLVPWGFFARNPALDVPSSR